METNSKNAHGGSPANPGRAGSGGPAPASADVLREQQAIATAMMLGEQMRRDDLAHRHILARRLGIFVCSMSLFCLAILFAFAFFAGDTFNPFPYMILLGLVAAGSAAIAYWGYVESRRADDD